MITYSQRDPKWSSDKLNGTDMSIGRYGCLVSSICTLMSKHGSKTTPKDAAKKWKFTKDGLLCWNNDFYPLTFKGRHFEYDEKALKQWLKSGDACVQVEGSHWLAADRFGIMGLICWDPFRDGWVRPMKVYKKITGLAFFSH